MIKILHTSDWHIDQLTKWTNKKSKTIEGLSEFSEYHLSRIQEMIDHAIKNKINIFVFAGDLFHDSLSNYKEKDIIYKELIKMVNQLKDNGIYTIFSSGNHDITRRIKEQSKTNSLELFHDINYDDFLFVNGPESDTIDYKDYVINGEETRIILFPYLRGIEDKSQVYDAINDIILDKPEGAQTIIIGHLDIFGALYNGIEIQSLDLKDTNTWHPEELEELGADLVLLGHVHNHQTLGSEKNIIYCGSPYRLSFNEEGIDKGFYIHQLDQGEIKSKFHKLKNKNWITFEYNLLKNNGSFLELLDQINKNKDLKDSIVRIKISNIEKKDYKYIPYKEISDILSSKEIFLFRGYNYSEKNQNSLNLEKSKKGDNLDDLQNSLQKEIEPKFILEKILKDDNVSEDFLNLSLKDLDDIISELNS